MKFDVNIKKLTPDAVTPKYGSEFAAGADLYACGESTVIAPGETKLIHTGIAIELPLGTVGLIYLHYIPEFAQTPVH